MTKLLMFPKRENLEMVECSPAKVSPIQVYAVHRVDKDEWYKVEVGHLSKCKYCGQDGLAWHTNWKGNWHLCIANVQTIRRGDQPDGEIIRERYWAYPNKWHLCQGYKRAKSEAGEK